jgi:glycosyltransferase involved in cell wall biosynthesis
VVSTNVGGVADVVLQNQTGFITPPGDTESFAEALLQLCENEIKRQEFGLAGQHYVKERYSYQRLVRDMSNYYEGLMRL